MEEHSTTPHPIYNESGVIVHDHPDPHPRPGVSSERGSTARETLNDVVDFLCESPPGAGGCWAGGWAFQWFDNIYTARDRN